MFVCIDTYTHNLSKMSSFASAYLAYLAQLSVCPFKMISHIFVGVQNERGKGREGGRDDSVFEM